MLPNGLYVARFTTPLGSGAGVLVLNDGRLRGGDSAIVYTGTYSQDANKFTAEVSTKRHTAGLNSVFGVDAITISLTGTSSDTTASCTGSAAGVSFKAELIRIGD